MTCHPALDRIYYTVPGCYKKTVHELHATHAGADWEVIGATHHNRNLTVAHSKNCSPAQLDEESSDVVPVRHTDRCVCNDKEVATEVLPARHVAYGLESSSIGIPRAPGDGGVDGGEVWGAILQSLVGGLNAAVS